ncbi:MAG: hypothetical protein ACRC28_16315 [Clostridium sp.]|uniref:hypothetical protein n=1 Tax=Clostridium sp. TaxID=1506 RepID=UPI003F3B12D1
MTKAFIVDEFCDFLDPNKICDNCGACLNLSKADLHAIKIEEISKNIDENEMIESELEESTFNENEIALDWSELINKAKKIDPNITKQEIEAMLKSTSIKVDEGIHKPKVKQEYDITEIQNILNADDIVEEVIYLEDLEFEEGNLEEDTEEIFPGLRRLKKKK